MQQVSVLILGGGGQVRIWGRGPGASTGRDACATGPCLPPPKPLPQSLKRGKIEAASRRGDVTGISLINFFIKVNGALGGICQRLPKRDDMQGISSIIDNFRKWQVIWEPVKAISSTSCIFFHFHKDRDHFDRFSHGPLWQRRVFCSLVHQPLLQVEEGLDWVFLQF